jgi:hypothetical protein
LLQQRLRALQFLLHRVEEVFGMLWPDAADEACWELQLLLDDVMDARLCMLL